MVAHDPSKGKFLEGEFRRIEITGGIRTLGSKREEVPGTAARGKTDSTEKGDRE